MFYSWSLLILQRNLQEVTREVDVIETETKNDIVRRTVNGRRLWTEIGRKAEIEIEIGNETAVIGTVAESVVREADAREMIWMMMIIA